MVRDDESVTERAAIRRLDRYFRAQLFLHRRSQGVFRVICCSLRGRLDWLLERLAHHVSGRLSQLLLLVLRLVLQEGPERVLLLDDLAAGDALNLHGWLLGRRRHRLLMVGRVFAGRPY